MKNGNDIKRAGIIFHRYGPYHICRINALNRCLPTTGFELSGITKEYKWDKIDGEQSFRRVTLFENEDSRDASLPILAKKIKETLDTNPVDVMLINGWGDRGGLLFLKWCLRHRVPAILMTEEIEQTFTRRLLKEYPKRKIVQLFDAALVGGKLQRQYAEKLGMPPALIEPGYDVIDNDYFQSKAKEAIEDSDSLRKQYGLPTHFFLSSNRFIEKKNLFRLLEAYRKYVNTESGEPWHLVMLGDGPLKAGLEAKVKELNLDKLVLMPGFLQYDTLPHYYGLAKVFVHASTSEQWGLVVNEAMASGKPVIVSDRVGCHEDLVENGINGFVFDPYNVDALAEKMFAVASLSLDKLQQMGEESRRIIDKYSPDAFGKSVLKLVEKIKAVPHQVKPSWNQVLLEMSIRMAAF